jgi:hypothetical protein
MNNFLIGLVALWLAVPALLAAQSAENKLAGIWEVKILPKDTPLPPLLSIAIFGGDGSFATKVSAKFPPVPPFKGFVDEVGPGYGRWVQSSKGV